MSDFPPPRAGINLAVEELLAVIILASPDGQIVVKGEDFYPDLTDKAIQIDYDPLRDIVTFSMRDEDDINYE